MQHDARPLTREQLEQRALRRQRQRRVRRLHQQLSQRGLGLHVAQAAQLARRHAAHHRDLHGVARPRLDQAARFHSAGHAQALEHARAHGVGRLREQQLHALSYARRVLGLREAARVHPRQRLGRLGHQGQIFGRSLLGVGLEARQQRVDGPRVAQRTQRERRGTPLRGLPCLEHQHQRLEGLGTSAQSQALRSAEHQLTSTGPEHHIQRRQRGLREALHALGQSLHRGRAHGSLTIAREEPEHRLDLHRAHVAQPLAETRTHLGAGVLAGHLGQRQHPRRVHHRGRRAERELPRRLSVRLGRRPQRIEQLGPVGALTGGAALGQGLEQLHITGRVTDLLVRREVLVAISLDAHQPRRQHRRYARRGHAGHEGLAGLHGLGQRQGHQGLERLVLGVVVTAAQQARQHVQRAQITAARQQGRGLVAQRGVVALQRLHQRLEHARIAGVAHAIDHGLTHVRVRASQRHHPRLQAPRCEHPRQTQERVHAHLGGARRQGADHALARALDAARMRSHQRVDGLATQVGRTCGQRPLERHQRARRVQRLHHGEGLFPHQSRRIGQRALGDGAHHVRADARIGRQRGQASQRIAPHAVRLVAVAARRRLTHQRGVRAEHQLHQAAARAVLGRRRRGAMTAHRLDQREDARGGRAGRLRHHRPAGEQATDPVLTPRLARLGGEVGVRHHGAALARTAEALGLAPERLGLRAQREHLHGCVALLGIVRGEHVHQHLEDRAARVGLGPGLLGLGVVRLPRTHQLEREGLERLTRQACFQGAGRGEPDLGVRRRQRRHQQVGRQPRAGLSHVARHDDREHQVLDVALGVREALQDTLQSVGAQRHEAHQRAAPDGRVLVPLRTRQHRDRASITQPRQALGGPRAHRQIGMSQRRHQRRLFAQPHRGRQAASTHLAHHAVGVVEERGQEARAARIAHVGHGASGAGAQLLGGPREVAALDGEQRPHRLDHALVAALAAQLGGPHAQLVHRRGEREGEGHLVVAHQRVQALQRGDGHALVVVLDQRAQALLQLVGLPAGQARACCALLAQLGARRALLVGVARRELGVGLEAHRRDRIGHQLEQERAGPVALLAHQITGHALAHVGVTAARRPLQRRAQRPRVPGPQRLLRLGPHLGGLIVQRVAHQGLGPRVLARHRHQLLERTRAHVGVGAAQRARHHPQHVVGRELLQHLEGATAHVGRGIVEQPLHASARPIVVRHHLHRGGQRPQRRQAHGLLALARQAQDGADRAAIAQRRQRGRAAQRGVGCARRERGEQASLVVLGHRAFGVHKHVAAARLQRLDRSIEGLALLGQSLTQPRPRHHTQQIRHRAHLHVGVVQRRFDGGRHLGCTRARERQAHQGLTANVGRALAQHQARSLERRALQHERRLQRGQADLRRSVAEALAHHAEHQRGRAGQRHQAAHRLGAQVIGAPRQRGGHGVVPLLGLQRPQRREHRHGHHGLRVA